MKNISHRLIALALLTLAPGACLAARAWLLPSQTIVARAGGWVTFDAANSDDLFSFNQGAMPVDQLSVTGPDGKAVAPQNIAKGKTRSSFDLELRAARHLPRRRGRRHGDGALGRRRQAQALARHRRGNGGEHSRQRGQARSRTDAAACRNFRHGRHAHRAQGKRRGTRARAHARIRTICMRARRRSSASCSTANRPRISR